MKIKATDYIGRSTEMTLATYVEQKIDGSDYDRGQLKAIGNTAENAGTVLGRLIETLADKGILKLDEVESIVKGFARGELTIAE